MTVSNTCQAREVFSQVTRSILVGLEKYSREARAILIADDRNREKVPHST